MKKLLSAITIIAILVILAAVGFFGYTKYQEVELQKSQLQSKIDDNKNEESTSKENNKANLGNSATQTTSNENNTQERSTQEGISKVVNRNNVFDYLLDDFKADGGDPSLVTFQEPTYENGHWKILANNKSGHGSYVFIVEEDGTVHDQ